MLKQDFKEGEMTLSSALALAVKVLNKTMDVSKLSAEKGESELSWLQILTVSSLFLLTTFQSFLGPFRVILLLSTAVVRGSDSE